MIKMIDTKKVKSLILHSFEDIGFGCGDQLLVWLKHVQPSLVVGITSDVSQYRIAAHKLDDQIQDLMRENVKIFCGDAVDVQQLLAQQKMEMMQFDHVFVLDALYHFRTRIRFWKQVRAHLKQDGRITMTDVVLTQPFAKFSWRIKVFLFIFCKMMDVPWGKSLE